MPQSVPAAHTRTHTHAHTRTHTHKQAVSNGGACVTRRTLDKPVREELGAAVAVHLLHRLLLQLPRLQQVLENALRDDRLRPLLVCGGVGRARAPEVVEGDVEPLVDGGMLRVILVAHLARGQPLLSRLRLSRGTILVGAADVHAVHAALAAVARVHVCRERERHGWRPSVRVRDKRAYTRRPRHSEAPPSARRIPTHLLRARSR
jgi:hypothetical protein